MRIVFFICLLCVMTFCCRAQNGKVLSGDTTYWHNIQHTKRQRLGLQDLDSSKNEFYFRFWTSRQIIDIWTTDGKLFNGRVVSYTDSYASNDKEKKSGKFPKIYFNRVDLDTIEAKKSFQLIKQVATIPSDKYIKGWTQGFDGIEYIFETSTPSTYNFRSYWTPTAQDSSLLEAKMIQSFVNNLSTLLNLNKKYDNFFATLKPGNYTDGFMITMKLKPKEVEYLKSTKPYRDYLNSIKNKLDNYLSDTLTKIFNKYGELKCYDEFFLTFSKNNKLLKVTTNNKLSDREDKEQFKVCKKKIFEAFKLINIDFVHSQVTYTRQLTFFDGKASVYYSGW